MALLPGTEDELDDLRIKVSEIMTRELITVPPDASIAEVAKLMDENNIGSVIVKEGGRVVGIITERDIIKRYAAKMKDKLPSEVKAREIMTDKLITIGEWEDIYEAARKMCEHNIRRLIVRDRNGCTVGIISMRDVMREAPHIWYILLERLKLARSLRSPSLI